MRVNELRNIDLVFFYLLIVTVAVPMIIVSDHTTPDAIEVIRGIKIKLLLIMLLRISGREYYGPSHAVVFLAIATHILRVP